MFRRKNLSLFVIVFLMTSLLLMACAPAATPTAEPEPEETEAPPEPTEAEEVEEEEPTEAPTEPAAMTFRGEVCNEDLTGETITVWQQAGTTGVLASILGNGLFNGTNDSIKAVNDSGGICGAMFELEFRDTEYALEKEIEAFNAAVEADVPFVLTYGSPASVGLKELTIQHKIPNLAAGLSADAFYNPRNGYTVGIAPIYSDQFAGFVQWLSENWDDVKPADAGDEIVVGVIGWDNAFGTGATTPEALAYAESLGVTVLPLEVIAPTQEADPTLPIQNLVQGGANVIYNQSLSITPAKVVVTLRQLDLYDSVLVGGVNWSINTDVQNIIGAIGGDPALYEGYYGVFPYLWWTDSEEPGVQAALAAFEAGGYPETELGVGYLISYAAIDAAAQITFKAIQDSGFENLNGETWFAAFQELGEVSAAGLLTLNVEGENRAPNQAQIRQVQIVDGAPQFVVVEDWFELPDTRPPAAE